MTNSEEMDADADGLASLTLEMVGYALHSNGFNDTEFDAHLEHVAEEIGPPYNQTAVLALLGLASVTATIVELAAEWSGQSIEEVMRVLVRGIQQPIDDAE